MASDDGPTATETPLITAAPPPPTLASPQTASLESVAGDTNPPPSLKRPREESPISPTSPTSAATYPTPRAYSPTKVARLGLTAQLSTPLQLTGAAALEEERRRKEEEQRQNPPGISENPNQKALSELMSGGTLVMSRPQDAPTNMDEIALAAEATAKALGPVTIPQPNVSDARTDISPHSASSAAGAVDTHPVISSPAPMDVDSRNERQAYPSQPEAQMDEKTATSLSYPGVLPAGGGMPAPAPPQHRQMSLPNNGEHVATSKKHKCPYCETEFTRHHNLKSHLLTHSQEKPYSCQTCNLRFRRLHDLKRHGKLHTGEKPHICPKCDRKFARGDALARHSKGAGGCAGRRASMGSYGEQGEYDGALRHESDDSAMTGVVYDGNGDVDMTEDERRRLSLPAIKAQHVAGSPETAPHSRTYPPIGPRPGASGVLYPPNVERGSHAGSGGPSSSLANSIGGHYPSPYSIPSMPSPRPQRPDSSNGSSLLQLQGITESPKPLSPPVHDQSGVARQHSPNLASQYQQQPYARRPSERDIHSLPPPLPAPHSQSHPKLEQLLTLGPGPNPIQGQQPPAGLAANASRTSSGPPSHVNSDDSSANLFAQGEQGLWAYIQGLEDKIKEMAERLVAVENVSKSRQAEVDYLTNEVGSLRKELADSRQKHDAVGPTV